MARNAAFARYVEAEQLRRANYRETVIVAHAADIDQRTQGAYAAAGALYQAAQDACGLRRARIGWSRMQVAMGNYATARATAQSALDVNV